MQLRFCALRLYAFTLYALFAAGCSTYHERFTHYRPDGGTNHVVNVGFNNFLMYGKAGKLQTQTQTEEFIRSVNGEGIELRPDSAAIKGIVEGVVEALMKQWKPVGADTLEMPYVWPSLGVTNYIITTDLIWQNQ